MILIVLLDKLVLTTVGLNGLSKMWLLDTLWLIRNTIGRTGLNFFLMKITGELAATTKSVFPIYQMSL